jgi:hypothetical protein
MILVIECNTTENKYIFYEGKMLIYNMITLGSLMDQSDNCFPLGKTYRI